MLLVASDESPRRVFEVGGWSYGGILTNYVLTKTGQRGEDDRGIGTVGAP
jgi:hypothetical protein